MYPIYSLFSLLSFLKNEKALKRLFFRARKGKYTKKWAKKSLGIYYTQGLTLIFNYGGVSFCVSKRSIPAS